MSKTDFDNKLKSFNIKINSKNLSSLIIKDYKFFLGRMYFTSNDGSQNTFIHQPILDTLELKKDKCTYRLCFYLKIKGNM